MQRRYLELAQRLQKQRRRKAGIFAKLQHPAILRLLRHFRNDHISRMRGWTNQQTIVAYNDAVEGFPWLLGEVQFSKSSTVWSNAEDSCGLVKRQMRCWLRLKIVYNGAWRQDTSTTIDAGLKGQSSSSEQDRTCGGSFNLVLIICKRMRLGRMQSFV